jgi:hypothetical protein
MKMIPNITPNHLQELLPPCKHLAFVFDTPNIMGEKHRAARKDACKGKTKVGTSEKASKANNVWKNIYFAPRSVFDKTKQCECLW